VAGFHQSDRKRLASTLEERGLGSSSIIIRMSAIRKLVASVQPRLAAQSAYQIVKFDVPGAAGTSP